MDIEIINVASSTLSGNSDSNIIGVIKLIMYKENEVENVVVLPDPDMNNFIPIDQVTNDTLVEWVTLNK